MDNYNLTLCRPGTDQAYTYDTGLYLEGLTVLADVTNDSGLAQL